MYYDSYGLIAQGSFDNIPYNVSVTYIVKISKKGRGSLTPNTLLFGQNPVVIRTLNDDAFGIKGSEVEVNILNINNTSPLSSFYSEEDDTFKLEVETIDPLDPTKNIKVFEGYLMQEDSSEALTDWGYEIKLTFTDNLGSLKYLTFDVAAKFSPTSAGNLRIINPTASAVAEATTTSQYLVLSSQQASGSPVVGDYAVLLNSPIGVTAFTIKKIEDVGPGLTVRRLYTTDDLTPYNYASTKLAYVTGTDYTGRIKLADALRICLHATNLNLPVFFGNGIKVYNNKNTTLYSDILNNVYIDAKTFMADENSYKSCYDVLESILNRFQCSICQQRGAWYITRWNDLINYNNQIPYTIYDGYLAYSSTITYNTQEINLFETGVSQTYLRPFNYFAEKLEYKYYNDLLYNRQLSKLGLKINQYTGTIDGNTVTYYEYDWNGWSSDYSYSNIFKSFIRITKDSIGQEIERLSGIRHLTGPYPYGAYSKAILAKSIECVKSDKFKFSFDIKNTRLCNTDLPIIIVFTNGIQTKYLTKNLENNLNKWENSPTIFNFDGVYNDYISFDFNSMPFPFDGILTIYLPAMGSDGSYYETLYRNINFEYIPYISKLSIATGHTHTTSINKIIKNNETRDIYIDDVQSNSLKGCLFLNTYTNLIQDKTALFNSSWRNGITSDPYLLGNITTAQMEKWRSKLRLKIEGKILGITNSAGDWLLLYKPLIFALKANKYFIFGKASYNLKEDIIEFTIYEMWDQSDTLIPSKSLKYNFKFLYK